MRRRLRTVAAATAAMSLLLAGNTAWACAGCRNPNLPITRLNAVQLSPGETRVSVTTSGTTVHVTHPAGCANLAGCTEVPVQPLFVHDQHLYPVELRPVIELGLTRYLGIETHLPFRLVSTTIKYTTPEGQPYVPLDPDVHHRDETLYGIGDPWLLLRAGTLLDGWLLQARIGSSIPLGHTEANPFALGAVGLRHEHIQFGTGTFDPIAAIDIAKRLGPVSASLYGQGQLSLYENQHGFRAGPRLLGGMQLGTRLSTRFLGAVTADVAHDGPERWGGAIKQDGLLGRTEVLTGVALTHTWGPDSLTLAIRFPVYRHLIAGDEPVGTLSSPVVAGLTWIRTFGAGG